MSHKIAALFGELEDKTMAELHKLEAACGFPAEDARLLAENNQTVRQKLADLNLDPDDTTPVELYFGLSARYQQDSQQIESALGLSNNLAANEKTATVIELLANHLNSTAWALKNSSAKEALKSLKPTRTKKILAFRSFDSMLKRQPAALLLLIAAQIESPSWRGGYNRWLKKSSASQWEARRPQLYKLPTVLNTQVAYEKSVGAVGISDSDEPVLGQFLEIARAISRLDGHDPMLELGKVHPALLWWASSSHLVAWLDGQPISFNIFDVYDNQKSDAPYKRRSYQHGGQSLWQRLVQRYGEYEKHIQAEVTEPARLAPEWLSLENFDG